MNEQLIQAIDRNITRLNQIRAIIETRPAFARWHTSGAFDLWLVQLFPDVAMGIEGVNEASYPIPDRQRDARAIARALGGHWIRRPDGSWERDRGACDEGAVVLRIILHRVDFDKPPASVGVNIDLNEEPAEAVAAS